MSYSISATGPTISAAREAIAAKFDETVLKHQAVHAKDREQALAAVDAFLAILGPQPEDHEVSISLSGSLAWRTDDPTNFTWANVSVSCGFRYADAQPATV